MTVRNKRQLNIYIDHDLVKWVKDEAARQRCSMSHIFRTLIIAEMNKK